jgi:hypothetical protein
MSIKESLGDFGTEKEPKGERGAAAEEARKELDAKEEKARLKAASKAVSPAENKAVKGPGDTK